MVQLDARKPIWLTCLGRKGSGKSHLAHRFWDSYPYDRLLIDPNGDVGLGVAEPVEDLELPLPDRWPEVVDLADVDGRRRRRRQTLRFVADMRSPTFVDDMDRAVGLAMAKGDVLIWLDEAGMLTRASYTPPNTRWMQHQHRHHNVSVLACQPRPIDISPLFISQANFIATFDLPHPRDRERLAGTMGFAPRDFDAAHEAIERPPEGSDDTWTGYLWWDGIRRQMWVMPPLPAPRHQRPSGQRFENRQASSTAGS